LDEVKEALKLGADVNCTDPKGRTPVALAILANSVSCTHELLTKGADPNIPDKNKDYPIHFAACFKSTDVLRVLVDSSTVELDVQNKDGDTALHKAAYSGCVDVVMYLTSKGADTKAQNNKFEIPAALARKRNHKGVLEIMKAAQLREKTGGGRLSVAHAENGMPLEPLKIDTSDTSDAGQSGGHPPPPPGGGPPPPPSGGGPPPPPSGDGPPPPPSGGGPSAAGGLAGSIANAKLKKTEKPPEEKVEAGGGGGGGNMGGMMAEMMKKRDAMKKKQSSAPTYTGPQLKQFEDDLMFTLKVDIASWKNDIITHIKS